MIRPGIATQQRRHDAGINILGNLLSYWDLDDNPATTCVDTHGSNDLSVVGTVTSTATAKNGSAFDLDGDHLLITPTGTGLDTTGPFTIFGWARWDAFNSGTLSACAYRGTAGSTTASTRDFLLAHTASSAEFYMRVYCGGSSFTALSTVTPATATWYFIVGIRDTANSKVLVSVNGETLVETAYTGTPNTNNGVFHLARGPSSGISNNWDINGQMDAWGFSTEVWDQAKVNHVYNGGAGRFYADF